MNAEVRTRELTAPGRGGIRVLELCGPGALRRVRRLAGVRSLPDAGGFALLPLRDARGALLDEALVLVESSSRVELHLHGAPALVARVLQELGLAREEPAARTLEDQAEELLARAASEAAARVLLDQARGALRTELERLLLRPDEELVEGARELARRGRRARWLLHPPRVVLAGPVNAGKSTLFNLLVGRERVVVDPRPGTTRDAVHERVLLGAHALELYDSAGARELADDSESARVERAGQALAEELRGSADLVLWLVPPWCEAPVELGPRLRFVGSCADLSRSDRGPVPWPTLSVRSAPAEARARVEEIVCEALGLPAEPWIPGAGVPFETGWCARLEDDEPAVLRTAVRSWLAGASPPD